MDKLRKSILYLAIVLLISSCQTHLPLVAEQDDASADCVTEAAGPIDYLLYANRMVDRMIADQQVQTALLNKRLRLFPVPLVDKLNTAQADIIAVNQTLKNRAQRSGQFIIVSNKSASDVQLSAVFEKITRQINQCSESYRQFAMQLRDSRTGKVIWSAKKHLK